ncbi:hypothetical protein Bca4012_056515 [Brassica carinata]
MTEHEAYVKMVVADAKVQYLIRASIFLTSMFFKKNTNFLAIEDINDFAAMLEQPLKDVPCADELNEVKKVVRKLKLSLKLAQELECASITQLAADEKLGNQAASFEVLS